MKIQPTYQVKTRFKYYTRFRKNEETYRKTDAEVDYKNDRKFMMFSQELAYLGLSWWSTSEF